MSTAKRMVRDVPLTLHSNATLEQNWKILHVLNERRDLSEHSFRSAKRELNKQETSSATKTEEIVQPLPLIINLDEHRQKNINPYSLRDESLREELKNHLWALCQ